jgi:DNA replication protein DnaC
MQHYSSRSEKEPLVVIQATSSLELIAERYERRLMATCNQPVSGWHQIFPNLATAVAAIDPLGPQHQSSTQY